MSELSELGQRANALLHQLGDLSEVDRLTVLNAALAVTIARHIKSDVGITAACDTVAETIRQAAAAMREAA